MFAVHGTKNASLPYLINKFLMASAVVFARDNAVTESLLFLPQPRPRYHFDVLRTTFGRCIPM